MGLCVKLTREEWRTLGQEGRNRLLARTAERCGYSGKVQVLREGIFGWLWRALSWA